MKKLLISLIAVIIWALSLQALAQDFITGRINWPYTAYDANIFSVATNKEGTVAISTEGSSFIYRPQDATLQKHDQNIRSWLKAFRVEDAVYISRSSQIWALGSEGLRMDWPPNMNVFPQYSVFNSCQGSDGAYWFAVRERTKDIAGNPIHKYGILKGMPPDGSFVNLSELPLGISNLYYGSKVGATAVAATSTHLFIGTLGEVENQSAVRAIYAYNLQTDSLYVAYEGNTNIVYDLEIMEVGTDTILVSGGEFYKIKKDGYLDKIGSISATVYDLTQLPGNKLVIGFQGGVMVIDVNQEYLEYIRETQVAPNKADVFGGAQVNSVSYHPESGKTWVGGKNGFLGWFIENDPTKPPLKPDKISATKIGAVSAKLEWPAYPAASNFDHLELLLNSNLVKSFTETGTETFILTDLRPATDYEVQLLAVNQNGLRSLPAKDSFQTRQIKWATASENSDWEVEFPDSISALARSIIIEPPQLSPGLELNFEIAADSSQEAMVIMSEDLVVNSNNLAELALQDSLRSQTFIIRSDLTLLRLGIGYSDVVVIPIPEDFALQQNYPNPFNPKTTIEYDLPEDALVVLTIYNLLGQKIRALVNAEQKARSHAVIWTGGDEAGRSVASGLYIYKLKAGSFVDIKKMLLIR